jgi:hypothetical protein
MRCGLCTGAVSAEFIEKRDVHVERVMREENVKEENAIRRWDCEFPEHHQSLIDPSQTLFEGNDVHSHHRFDTIDEELGNCDYKQNSKEGVHISSYIYDTCKAGIIDHIVVWEWANSNRHKRLYINDEVSYIILGAVTAQQIIETAKIVGYDYKNRPKYRFPFEKGVKYV